MTNTATDTTGIITQAQFDQGTAKWAEVVGSASGADLKESFLTDSGAILAFVDFPILQVAQLVSAVGATHVKAKFLVNTDATTGKLRFTVALFAADALDARLTSYYVAEAAPALVPSPLPNEVVADVLAGLWIQNWAALDVVTPPLFASSYGPLQGYTFEVLDFLAPFLELTAFKGEKLRVHFGLHEYYRPGPDGDELGSTFGLVLQLWRPTGTTTYDLYYDVSMPCPPTC